MCNCGQSVKRESSVKQVTKRTNGGKKVVTPTRRVVVKRPAR